MLKLYQAGGRDCVGDVLNWAPASRSVEQGIPFQYFPWSTVYPQ